MAGAAPVNNAIREPKGDLLLGTLHSITAVDNIPIYNKDRYNTSLAPKSYNTSKGWDIPAWSQIQMILTYKLHIQIINRIIHRPTFRRAIILIGILENAKRWVLPANFNAVIASDGSGLGSSRVGGPDDLAAGRHNTLSLPHHGNHWTRDDVLYQGAEERLGGEVRVMLLSEGSLHLDHLHGCSGPRHLGQNSPTQLQRLPIYMQGIHPTIKP